MKTQLSQSLLLKLTLPTLAIFSFVAIAASIYVPQLLEESAVDTAVKSAENTVKQYKTMRAYYTKNVVKKVLNGSEMKPHFDHEGDASKIPLPATFIHDLSQELAKQGTAIKLYSNYPFPNRSERQLDSFQKSAWQALNKQPDTPFTQVDGHTVRVAVADTMAVDACVSCHNKHPDTPKNNWSLGDVRGVLEVQVSLESELATASSIGTQVLLLLIAAMAAVAGISYFIFEKYIRSKLHTVIDAIDELSDGTGHLHQRLNEGNGDEIDMVARSFNKFIGGLEKTVGEVSEETRRQVEILQTLTDVAARTQEQIMGQEQETDMVASAANEMTASSQEVENIAATTAENASAVQNEAQDVRNTVMKNMDSVTRLSTEMKQAAEVVNLLETESQNIGGVLEVIRGIAEQTNLLALNAAIEAARAGEQGRGFAVVADEVRTLASRTQSSTEEIQSMIQQLQEGSKNAVHAISKGTESLQDSLGLADESNRLIDSIVDRISNSQNIYSQIASAAQEQTTVSEEINCNITKIADLTKINSNGVMELRNSIQQIENSISSINIQLEKFTTM